MGEVAMTDQNQTRVNPTLLLARQVQETASVVAHLEQIQQQNALIIQRLERLAAKETKITDVNMPFWALVGLMVKVALASVPAGIVIGLVYLFVIMLLSASCWAGS